MGKVVEAKDLVYQKGVKTPVVPIESDLKSVIHYFDEFPCLPVVQGDQHLVGLLFVSDVRLAYDREVSRRSFDFMPKDKK